MRADCHFNLLYVYYTVEVSLQNVILYSTLLKKWIKIN